MGYTRQQQEQAVEKAAIALWYIGLAVGVLLVLALVSGTWGPMGDQVP
jgi:hypothetical protein